MKTEEALKIIGGSLSKPSKMPGWSIGLPAKECKTGAKLQAVPGSVCYDCYALKGCYVFKVVQDAQYRRLKAIQSPQWVQAMAHLINSKKPDVFRWHDSGDVQDLNHLKKIYEVCRLTPSKRHWLPTREAWIKDHLDCKPNNLVIRFSAPMVNQRAPESCHLKYFDFLELIIIAIAAVHNGFRIAFSRKYCASCTTLKT